MSTKLSRYLDDGANKQARAVMCMLQDFTIEESWNDTLKRYDAEPKIARWENCREQGYVLMLRAGGRVLNIAFFEHRNSDSICAIKWEQWGINSPTIETAKFEGVYKDKWDVSFTVGYGEILKMSLWISDELTAFYRMAIREEGAAK